MQAYNANVIEQQNQMNKYFTESKRKYDELVEKVIHFMFFFSL
jgi:hypothetical protein